MAVAAMRLAPRHYVRFLDGRHGDWAVIAFLPGDLAAQMPTLSTEVRIGRDYAVKLWRKHGLGYAELATVQRAIDGGWRTRSRPNSLDFLYIESRPAPMRFILGLKAAYGGEETWLQTLYRCHEGELRRRLRRAREADVLLRAHVWS